jgi:NAD(P)-dependent dehydrogenase (short-subunit alcohol dehydrogenase family)
MKKKVVLITGSSRGIGNAIARKCAEAGADIAINYRRAGGTSQAAGEALCREIQAMGQKAIIVQADIAVKESVKKLFQDTAEKLGRLDCLVLNAARAPFKPIHKLFERELKQLVETNYMGNIFCIQESLSMLEESSGKIVFISSLGSRFYNPAYPLGSMKAAMESVVRDSAETLREKKISINGVCGGIVKTDSFKILRQYWDNIDMLPEELFVDPDEMADVVLFLCGSESRGISGQTIVVDKGLSNSLFRTSGK